MQAHSHSQGPLEGLEEMEQDHAVAHGPQEGAGSRGGAPVASGASQAVPLLRELAEGMDSWLGQVTTASLR